jgi:hypothetical protein
LPVVRRALCIFVALLVSAASVGALGWLHEHTPGHHAHDESTCQLGMTLRAPMPHTPVPTPQLSLVVQPWPSDPIQHETTPQRLARGEITCRGPPAC